MRVISSIIFASMILFLSACAYADVVYVVPGKENTPTFSCDQKEGIGSVFYNFKNLFVSYGRYPSPEEQNADSFPPQLKFESFNKRLVSAIERNFAPCLKASSGEKKNIEVFLPRQMASGGWNERCARKPNRVHNPENLTIHIDLYYRFPKNPAEDDYGYASFFLYRPEVAHKPARVPLPNNSGIVVFFPKKGGADLSGRLDSLFAAIRPISPMGSSMDSPGQFTINDACGMGE